MLNSTRAIFKELLSITDSAVFEYPKTYLSDGSVVLVEVNMSEENPFEQFGIYSLSRLLNVIDFFQNPTIDQNGSLLIIRDQNKRQIYETTNTELLKAYHPDSTIFEKVSQAPADFTIQLNKEQFSEIKKVATVLNHEKIIIYPHKIVITTIDSSENFIEPFELYLNQEKGGESVGVIFDFNDFGKLPINEYVVDLKKSKSTGNWVAYLQNDKYNIIVGAVGEKSQ